jgi:hypothetical protein
MKFLTAPRPASPMPTGASSNWSVSFYCCSFILFFFIPCLFFCCISLKSPFMLEKWVVAVCLHSLFFDVTRSTFFLFENLIKSMNDDTANQE